MTILVTLTRYCSGDLFLVIVVFMNGGIVYGIKHRKELIKVAAKRKWKKVLDRGKRRLISHIFGNNDKRKTNNLAIIEKSADANDNDMDYEDEDENEDEDEDDNASCNYFVDD